MWTINYRGHYIQGYCDRKHVYVRLAGSLQWFKSLLAAKRAINRVLDADLDVLGLDA